MRSPDMLRLLRKDEGGQAIVLASVAMLIMVIGVMATINIGQTIHKRIHLQNLTDTAAYSLAAQEARLFNFWAFTNRAQASRRDRLSVSACSTRTLSFGSPKSRHHFWGSGASPPALV